MDKRRGWLRRDGWWSKDGWGFELRFTEEAEQRFDGVDMSELQDLVQYVTHVRRFNAFVLGFDTLFNAMKLSEPTSVKHISLQIYDEAHFINESVPLEDTSGYFTPNELSKLPETELDYKTLARAIEGGFLQTLKCLELDKGVGHSTLARAMASGGLPSLQTLGLHHVRLTADESKEYGIALGSGKLPNLSCLDISSNYLIGNTVAKYLALTIRSGGLKNLTELKLSGIGITDEGLIELTNSFQECLASLLPNIGTLDLGRNFFTDMGLLQLTKALSSGIFPNLYWLDISGNQIGNEGAKSVALVIRSGKFKNLAKLALESNSIGDGGLLALVDSYQEGVASLLPKLSTLNLRNNCFTEVSLLALAEALKSGFLNSLRGLDVSRNPNPSKECASALVSALVTNNCLTLDIEYEWYKFPELNRRREQLIERNSRNRDILDGLIEIPKVQATTGKVYICGNPQVGKTTLRHTLQRSYWKSLITWERKPHVEKGTRGIDVSQISSDSNKPYVIPITLSVWDMAGQEEFHVVHNSFFADLGFAVGKATTFMVVCSSRSTLQNSKEQLEYWLRYIASSCDKTIQNPRHVFVVMNNFKGDQKIHRQAKLWKLVLEEKRDKFEQYLKIQTDLFLVDVRKFQQVEGLKRCLLEHSRNLLRNQEVPSICLAIQKNLTALSQQREQFPVLRWTEFVEHVGDQLEEYWPEHLIQSATQYLNEAGVMVYINMEGVRLVVVDPDWFCREIIGKVFLTRELASQSELLFREQVDQSTGSIYISSFKKFFKSLEGEWNDAQVDDMIAILLWLGLCYKGKDENIFLPALIAEKGTPGDSWSTPTTFLHGRDHWVMGFSVRHQKNGVALAPISLWHRFQVDLAQFPKFNGERPDNDFVADKYFMTFVVDYMNVLIEVDASLEKPTFEEISILVKPRFASGDLDATERKQCQVDLANDLVERLLKLWNKVCPGVEYEQRVLWPWPASSSRPTHSPERNVEVVEVKKWVQERGVGTKMQWVWVMVIQ